MECINRLISIGYVVNIVFFLPDKEVSAAAIATACSTAELLYGINYVRTPIQWIFKDKT